MKVKLGLEVLIDEQPALLAGQRVGLVTNMTGIDHNLVSSVERLHQHAGINLVALLGPEHGLRGEAQAGEHIATYTDSITGLPVYSLFGATHKPTPDMLSDLDVLVFDMQDAGVRFYTYITTLAYVMQAGAEHGIPVIVLDRPAPLTGLRIEGPVLDPDYSSFVGAYAFPLRYGMTLGEMAGLFNEVFHIGCDLTVVPLVGWDRSMWYDQTDIPFVAGSPNLSKFSGWIIYPGTCLFEGTSLSEGRGTTRAYEYIGAPWIQGEHLSHELNQLEIPGVRFRPIYFVPTFSKYIGERCSGVHVYVTDRDQLQPIQMALSMMQLVKEMYPKDFTWREPWSPESHRPIDLLTGGNTVREHLNANRPIDELVDSWQEGLHHFRKVREPYLLYPHQS